MNDLVPIGILLAVIVLVVWRLPRVPLGHSAAFRQRRAFNWVPLGLTYAFLYMGRYNLNAFKAHGLTSHEFGVIFGVGSLVYGVAFLLNGPLTDRWGGRRTIQISSLGSALCNGAMGLYLMHPFGQRAVVLSLLYGANMYFQSFGAVSIVKVNAGWFHVRERGTLGGVFGILISLGLYFAYDWGGKIADNLAIQWLFFIPALILVLFFVLSSVMVRDNPSDAGFKDFDTGDATSGDVGPRQPVAQVFRSMMANKVIVIIACIELCSGFLRQAILQWGKDFGIFAPSSFVYANWGLVNCIAGITGGMFAGVISDHLFGSRRAPVSAVLYGIMLFGAIAITFLFHLPYVVPWVIAGMSMALIGVHGMLSGTASADFGGRKNAGVATGIIDGFVYLGSTVQSFFYGATLPQAKIADAHGHLVANPAALDVHNWLIWPLGMIPVALIGLFLASRVWHARPQPKNITVLGSQATRPTLEREAGAP
jgi:OPA family glycerol-3-phosphate transporter-like MFS transporter